MVSQDYPESPKEVQPEVVADRALQEYLAIPEILQAGVGIPGKPGGTPGMPGGKPAGGVGSRLGAPGIPSNPTGGVGGTPGKPGSMILVCIEKTLLFISKLTQQPAKNQGGWGSGFLF